MKPVLWCLALNLHANRLSRQWKANSRMSGGKKTVFFCSCVVRNSPNDLRHPLQYDKLTSQIQFFPFRRSMRAAMKSSNTYRDGLRRIILHLSHFIPTWAGGGGVAGLAAIVQTAVRQDTVEWVKIAPPLCATAQTTAACTLSIRRGCRSQFSGRDGICFIFTRTPSPCQAVQGVITECWYQEQSKVPRISCLIQTDNHEWSVSSTLNVVKNKL